MQYFVVHTLIMHTLKSFLPASQNINLLGNLVITDLMLKWAYTGVGWTYFSTYPYKIGNLDTDTQSQPKTTALLPQAKELPETKEQPGTILAYTFTGRMDGPANTASLTSGFQNWETMNFCCLNHLAVVLHCRHPKKNTSFLSYLPCLQFPLQCFTADLANYLKAVTLPVAKLKINFPPHPCL